MHIKKLVITNAFSINMLKNDFTVVKFSKLTLEQIKAFINKAESISSVVGHEDTAEIFSNLLEVAVPFNRVNYKWEDNSTLIVGQLKGRLPEGTKTLPENVNIEWYLVEH